MNTTVVSDLTLIQRFVKGELTLAANANLRIESSFHTVQLLTRRGVLLAATSSQSDHSMITVRSATDYLDTLVKVLEEEQYVLTHQVDSQGLLRFEKRSIPEGYRVKCTDAKQLWKTWWTKAKHTSIHAIEMELLVFVRGTWYPIREIVCNQGNIFVRTLVTEMELRVDTLVPWLVQVKPIEPLRHTKTFTPQKQPKSYSAWDREFPQSASSDITTSQREQPTVVQRQPRRSEQGQPVHSPASQATVRRSDWSQELQSNPRSQITAHQTRSTTPPAPPRQSQQSEWSQEMHHSPTQSDAIAAKEKRVNHPTAPLPSDKPPVVAEAVMEVVRQVHSRLYIKTAIGEIIVEGDALKCWMSQSQSPEKGNPPVQINHRYQNREHWAINS